VKFLLLNQTFRPDVASTAQHLTDLALRLAERGHEVSVITSRRAYDHPETEFPKSETWRGIRIHRVGSTGFGKGAKWRRAADFGSFLSLCSLRLARMPRHDVVVALTSPPLISVLGAGWAKLHRSRFIYWVMDFNPDEAIAAGWLRPESLAARLLEWMSRFSLRHAHKVIALDRFMRDRIVAKGIPPTNVVVIPPWSHDTEVKFDPEGRERFRKAHGLDGKFVVMYSGNHSPCHPLDTLLGVARKLASDPTIIFCFVGGGSEWRKIQQMVAAQNVPQASLPAGSPRVLAGSLPSTLNSQPSTILCLPYQPLDQLSASLSAADLHVVVMGNAFVGLVHPCKIYNVLNVGAPVLYIGPRLSHISEIAAVANGEVRCLSAGHGEVDLVVKHILCAREEAPQLSRHSSSRGPSLFSKESLLPKLIAELESA
jgi:glycosyltransferase involved in cell wall biosynthesis